MQCICSKKRVKKEENGKKEGKTKKLTGKSIRGEK